MKNLKLLLLLIVASAIYVSGQAKSQELRLINTPAFETVKIGSSTTIKIPAIDGFVHAVQNGTPASERYKPRIVNDIELLSFYLSPDDWKKAEAGEQAVWRYFVQISTNVRDEETGVSAEEFDQLASKVTNGLDQLFDGNGKTTTGGLKVFHTRLDQIGNDGGLQKLGVVSKSKNMFSALLTQSGNVNGEKITYIVTGTSIYLKRRVLFLHIYRQYRTEADIDVLGELTMRWATAILGSNM